MKVRDQQERNKITIEQWQCSTWLNRPRFRYLTPNSNLTAPRYKILRLDPGITFCPARVGRGRSHPLVPWCGKCHAQPAPPCPSPIPHSGPLHLRTGPSKVHPMRTKMDKVVLGMCNICRFPYSVCRAARNIYQGIKQMVIVSGEWLAGILRIPPLLTHTIFRLSNYASNHRIRNYTLHFQ